MLAWLNIIMFKRLVSSLQLARDKWRRKLGIWLFDRHRPACEPGQPFKRVVLVRWDAKWGDAIVSSFIFREWRRAYPGIQLDVITSPVMAGLFRDHFAADNVYETVKRPSYTELKTLAKALGPADLLVHLSKSLKMKDLYFLSQVDCRMIAGLDDQIGMINLKLGSATRSMHFTEKFSRLLEQTGVCVHNTDYQVPVDILAQQRVAHFLENIPGPLLILNPYGSGQARRLRPDTIKQLIACIRQARDDVRIGILSTPDTQDEVSRLCQELASDKVFYYPDSRTIYDAIALVSRADWVVSVDTAIVHIAVGLKRPLLAIYNPDKENFAEWGPNSDLAISIFAEPVNPPDINGLDWQSLPQRIEHLLQLRMKENCV